MWTFLLIFHSQLHSFVEELYEQEQMHFKHHRDAKTKNRNQLSCLFIKKLQDKPAKLVFHIDETIQDWQAKEGRWEVNCWNYHCIYYLKKIEKLSQRKNARMQLTA